MPRILAQPQYTCDVCDAPIAPEQIISFKISVAGTGHNHVPSFECEDEQHYGCCPEHALEAAKRCMQEHLEPRRQQLIQAKEAEQSSRHAGAEASC